MTDRNDKKLIKLIQKLPSHKEHKIINFINKNYTVHKDFGFLEELNKISSQGLSWHLIMKGWLDVLRLLKSHDFTPQVIDVNIDIEDIETPDQAYSLMLWLDVISLTFSEHAPIKEMTKNYESFIYRYIMGYFWQDVDQIGLKLSHHFVNNIQYLLSRFPYSPMAHGILLRLSKKENINVKNLFKELIKQQDSILLNGYILNDEELVWKILLCAEKIHDDYPRQLLLLNESQKQYNSKPPYELLLENNSNKLLSELENKYRLSKSNDNNNSQNLKDEQLKEQNQKPSEKTEITVQSNEKNQKEVEMTQPKDHSFEITITDSGYLIFENIISNSIISINIFSDKFVFKESKTHYMVKTGSDDSFEIKKSNIKKEDQQELKNRILKILKGGGSRKIQESTD